MTHAQARRWPHTLLLGAALTAAASALLLARPDTPLSQHLALALALLAGLCLWTADLGPRGASALLLLIFVDLLGLVPQGMTFAGFAQPSFFFLLAVLFIGSAIETTGTNTRLGRRLLGRPGALSRASLLWKMPLLMLASAALVSSATARVSLAHPVFDRLLDAPGTPHPGLAKYLTLLVSHLSPLMSRAFLSGGPGIIVAAELMREAGYELSWGAWVLWLGLPVTLILALTTLAHALWLRPHGSSQDPQPSPAEPFTAEDRYIGLVLLGTILLWTLGATLGVSAAATAVLGMAALSLLPNGKQTLRSVNWDLVVFAGATLSFAHILLATGTADWLGRALFAPLQAVSNPQLALTLVFAVLVMLRLPLSNGLSYSAMVFPLILSIGPIGGIATLHLAFMALVAGALIFLPIQANTTMITYASGRYAVHDSIISGLLTFTSALIVFQWLAVPYWNWLAHALP